MTSGRFNLADYVTVAERLEKFWAQYPDGRIDTALVSNAGGKVVIKASVYRDIADPAPTATGHAHEVEGQGMVNTTSAMENCETSAVGRALALMGYEIKKGIASREEMAAAQQRPQTPPQTPRQSAPQGAQGQPQARQSAPAAEGTMPIGKYTGKRMADIPQDYLEWAKGNMARADAKEMVIAELERREAATTLSEMGEEVEHDGTPFDA
jgi:hypothetical protein